MTSTAHPPIRPSASLDVESLRRDFPILATRVTC